ncbi:glycosyltransferase family 2 protein [Chryseobacterium lacus]|uniref:Glycosyltransferase family 2 protein n=1 Tax=Chryseobacterium lacus TaxID=2058346 RepID=A0A368N097_9FLAO|nr:glycosyltransferase [Chryseobacterium lacus]RCU43908.1 glycosyltransferase family 2 protein [Chryseobacterium lacus]RST28836.1 glycosyltransferase family 2 protein [Chryseobacterium lacus]
MEQILYFYQYLIYFYSFAITIFYLFLMICSYFMIEKKKIKYTHIESELLVSLPEYAPYISIIAPAFNEEVIIIDNVKSLMSLNYPNYEVIIVNDGSEDKTLELLIENFDLEEIAFPYIEKVRCRPVKRVFKSTNIEFQKLIVVDKINGGTKADAMNAGVNVANYDYFINTDVDCLLAPDTLTKVILPVLDSKVEVIAVGATMRMSNGCEVKHGVMTRVRPPKGIIPTFQETEYLRSYLLAKMGWSMFNLIPNVSGGFGLFSRTIVIEAGGFDPLSHAEDMDMTMRMVAYMRENNRKYRIVQIPDTCCWTQGPPNLKVLNRQRTRWGRGLLQIFVVHRKFLFNRKYGRMGLVIMPYALIFEFLAPIIELTGLVTIIYLLFTSQINFNTFWLMLLYVYLIGITMSLMTISYDVRVKRQYKTYPEYLRLILFSSMEAFVYHPLVVFFSLKGYWQFLTRKNFSWGAMTRQGFSQQNPPSKTAA